MAHNKLPTIIAGLYALVDQLQDLFPTRKFTLDGHLVGSIGEVVSEYFYDLKLSRASAAHDAVTREHPTRTVQIKLTAGNSVAVAVQDSDPDLLIVLHINRKSGFTEIYNGEFPTELLESKKPSTRRVRTVSFTQLRGVAAAGRLSDNGRIKELNLLFEDLIK